MHDKYILTTFHNQVEIFDIKVGEKAFTQYAEEGLYDFAPGSKHHAEFVEFNNKTKGITPNTKKTVKQMESIKKKQLTSVMNQSVIHYKHCLFSLYFQVKFQKKVEFYTF